MQHSYWSYFGTMQNTTEQIQMEQWCAARKVACFFNYSIIPLLQLRYYEADNTDRFLHGAGIIIVDNNKSNVTKTKKV